MWLSQVALAFTDWLGEIFDQFDNAIVKRGFTAMESVCWFDRNAYFILNISLHSRNICIQFLLLPIVYLFVCFLEMLEYNDERRPWETMEEKLSLIRYCMNFDLLFSNDMYACALGEQLRKPTSETFQLWFSIRNIFRCITYACLQSAFEKLTH